jgi:hypothetical protein
VTPQEELEGAAFRILRAAYLRVCCHFTGRKPERVTEGDQTDLLDRWAKTMDHDATRLGELLRQSRAQGISSVHGRLHGRPGVDHEMLDQAVEYAGGE